MDIFPPMPVISVYLKNMISHIYYHVYNSYKFNIIWNLNKILIQFNMKF